MSWSLGFDDKWQRWVGYGVPAYCDHPLCIKKIDRGLSHVCGADPFGGNMGCGLYFCEGHLSHVLGDGKRAVEVCMKCHVGMLPFEPKPEHPQWCEHLLTDESWQQWRDENPAQVEKLLEQR